MTSCSTVALLRRSHGFVRPSCIFNRGVSASAPSRTTTALTSGTRKLPLATTLTTRNHGSAVIRTTFKSKRLFTSSSSILLRSTTQSKVTAGCLLTTASFLAYGYYNGSLKYSNTTSCTPQQLMDQPLVEPLLHMSEVSLDIEPFDDVEEAIAPTKKVTNRYLLWIYHALHNCWDTVLVVIRGTEIVVRLSPLFVLTPAAVLVATLTGHQPPKDGSNGSSSFVADWAWWYTVRAMQSLGPSFVKLCQWIATRRDIFPPHVCDRLAILHDHGLPHGWNYSHQTLQEAFGMDYEERGLIVEPNVIMGCGSAAQVYRGKLTKQDANGNLSQHYVAVKILHPHFKRNVERDLWLLNTVATFLHSLPVPRIRMMNIPRAAETFANILRRQSDLRVEADNLRQFRANFYQDSDHEERSEIIFPCPMEGWTTEKVLVEELVSNATPIAFYLQDSSVKGKEFRKALGAPLFRAFLKMVFLDNFVHCDLHPGNVLVLMYERQDGKEPLFPGTHLDRKIVFLDAGIAFSLEPNDQKNLRDLFRAVVLNDGNTAGRLMVERAKYETCSQRPGGVEEFAAAMQDVVSDFHDRRKGGLTFGAVRIGQVLTRVLDLCREYGVEIDPSMAGVVISCLVLEGLARSLEPSLNLLDAALPFVIGRGKV